MTRDPWKIVDEYYYEKFKIFQLKRSKRINPRTGQAFDFFLMEGLDWVNVIAITRQNELVLVRQLRHGSGEVTLELPGGCVEPGEDPAVSARRELLEETGYGEGECTHVGTFYPNPAMQAMRSHCYVIKNVERKNTQALDPGEDIEVITRPLAELKRIIDEGEIKHGVVLAALALFLVSNKSDLP